MSDTSAGTGGSRMKKHTGIMHQVTRYGHLIDDLDGLLADIRGMGEGGGPKMEKMPGPVPAHDGPTSSLAEFLANEADRIANTNKQFEEIMISIRGELF